VLAIKGVIDFEENLSEGGAAEFLREDLKGNLNQKFPGLKKGPRKGENSENGYQ